MQLPGELHRAKRITSGFNKEIRIKNKKKQVCRRKHY